MAVIATMAFSSCQKEYIYVGGETGNYESLEKGEGIITIGVSNTGIGTKSARPVGSSAADNNVNKVLLVAYKYADGSYTVDSNVKIKSYNSGSATGFTNQMLFPWTNTQGSEGAATEEHLQGPHTVKVSGMASDVRYKFVAIGYHSDSEESAYGTFSDENNDGIFTTANAITDQHLVEELFAGTSNEVNTNNQGMFTSSVSVTLTRQVAGMLGYFKNIPIMIGESQVKYVKVFANAKYSTFSFPHQTDYNGVTRVEDDTKYCLLSFDLSKIATNYASHPDASYYTFNKIENGQLTQNGSENTEAKPFSDNYTMADNLSIKENSIFGGCYIIPYGQNIEGQTLTVELQDMDASPLATFNVKSSGQSDYDILCNNFYSIGKKLKTDTTTPDPEDPDEPIDLSGNTNIEVIINDQWDVLHNMGIE